MAAEGITNAGEALPWDSEHRSIQVASQIQTQDKEATPNESPLTVTATVDALKIPDGAISVVLRAVGADLRVGEGTVLDGTAGEGYFLVPAGTAEEFDCADGTDINVKRDAAVSVTMYFFFKKLEGSDR